MFYKKILDIVYISAFALQVPFSMQTIFLLFIRREENHGHNF